MPVSCAKEMAAWQALADVPVFMCRIAQPFAALCLPVPALLSLASSQSAHWPRPCLNLPHGWRCLVVFIPPSDLNCSQLLPTAHTRCRPLGGASAGAAPAAVCLRRVSRCSSLSPA